MDMANVAVSHLVRRSSVEWSETNFAKFLDAPQNSSGGNRHSFVIYIMSAKYVEQEFNFQCQDSEIFTPLLSESAPA